MPIDRCQLTIEMQVETVKQGKENDLDSSPKVLGYIRVSSKKQAKKGLSLNVQREKVKDFASEKKLNLIEIIEDGGTSAESLDRKGIQEVLRRLDRGEADGVVVVKLDRLTRLVRDWACLVEDRFGRENGPVLFSVMESFDLRTPNGRFFGNLIISFSQMELEAGVDRSEAVMGEKREKGQRLGTIPFGKRLDSDGKSLVTDFDELATLNEMVCLCNQKWNLRAIGEHLDANGFKSRSGRPWATSSIAKLLSQFFNGGGTS
jgi:site-specific DNA recombinase